METQKKTEPDQGSFLTTIGYIAGFLIFVFVIILVASRIEGDGQLIQRLENEKKSCLAASSRREADLSKCQTATASLAKEKEAFEGTLDNGLKKGNKAYHILGQATVLLDQGCHGVLINYRHEVVILTAAHCAIDRATKTKKEAINIKLSYYYKEPQDAPDASFYAGYGFLDQSSFDVEFKGKQIGLVKICDIALLRSKSLQKQALEQRALTIAPETPQPKQLINSTHWQPRCWELTANDCQEGELLIPYMGISRDYSTQRNTYDYALPAYPGDSGSGIINKDAKRYKC